MRSKPTLTPVLGAALAAVAAGSLLAFSLVAQHAGLTDITTPGPAQVAGPGTSLGAITLPGTPAAPASATPEAPALPPTLVASAPAPTPESAPPALFPGFPTSDEPSFDGLDDSRRPTGTARVGDGELERGRPASGRGAAKHRGLTGGEKGSFGRSVPPGHARKADASSNSRDRGHGPPSKQEAGENERCHGRGKDQGHEGKGHGKHKRHGKHH